VFGAVRMRQARKIAATSLRALGTVLIVTTPMGNFFRQAAKGDCHDADRFVVSVVGLIFGTLSRPLQAAAIALLPGVMTSHNVTQAW
jgi:hypothetical protein